MQLEPNSRAAFVTLDSVRLRLAGVGDDDDDGTVVCSECANMENALGDPSGSAWSARN